MPYPYDYTYFRPSKGEQLALMGGSIGSALLGAMGGNTKGDAIKNAIAGAVAGYGGGYKNYQDMMGDAWRRNLSDRQFDQDVKSYEEIDKPYKQALIKSMGNKVENPPGMGRMNEYNAFKNLPPEEQSSYYDYLSKTGYNRVLGMDDTGNPIFIPTRGNVQLKTPENISSVSNATAPVINGKNIQPLVKPTLPAEQGNSIGTLDSMQKDINELRDLFEKSKGNYTGWQGIASKGGQYLPENWGGISPENRKFRATYSRLYKNMFGEGGKTLSESEQKILKPIYPDINKTDEQFLIDLDNLDKTYTNLKQSRLNTFSNSGYRNIGNIQEGLTPSNAQSKGKLTVEQASKYLIQANGDRKKAEDMARNDGLEF